MIPNIYKNTLNISLFVMLVCVLQACSSGSSDIKPDARQDEMQFATTNISRAVTSSIDYAGSRFVVFGDMRFQTNSPNEVFNTIEVEYDGNAWNYEGTQYWFPLYEYSFVAVYPVHSVKNTGNPKYEDSKLSIDCVLSTTVGENHDKEELTDMLVATHRRNYDPNIGNTVSFMFEHIMSLVNFAPEFFDNIAGLEDYIKIHKLEFSEINTKTRLDIMPAPLSSNNQTNDMMVDMIPQEYGKSTVVFKKPVMVKNGEGNVDLFAREDAIVMIPQTFSVDADAQVAIYYTINDEPAMLQANIPLNNQVWESGKSYRYKFTLGRTGLTLDKCEINPWNEIKGGEITVD